MKMTTKGIYALEIIIDLAINATEGKLENLKNIATRRKLSEKYLERIMRALKSRGLVTSVRGAYGGYCLAKSVDVISVAEVLDATEGDLSPVECVPNGRDCQKIDKSETCPTRATWTGVWKQITEVTDHVTIGDLVKEKNRIEKKLLTNR